MVGKWNKKINGGKLIGIFVRFLPIILLLAAIFACHKENESEYVPPQTSVVDMQFNFHVVAPGFWRSGPPNRESIICMKTHGLKTIINLRGDEETNLWEKEIADSLNLNYYNYPLDSRVEQDKEKLNEILSIITELKNQPVLVHCLGGKDRSGMIAGIYKIQHTDLDFEDIRREMLMYGHDEESYPDVLEAVKNWNGLEK